MVARLRHDVFMLAAALLLVPGLAQAQAGGRYRVLIPYFSPMNGANKNFGKDAAKELRELINTLPTHQPIPEDEIKNQLKRFDLDMEDLDCNRTKQLAPQINAQVALCASYTESGDDRIVEAQFWDVQGMESFDVSSVTVNRREQQAAAQHIFDEFDGYVQQARAAQSCAEYAQSQQWDNAMRNCDRALELNPNAVATRYQRAFVLWKQEHPAEALEELDRVLEANPIHEDALQLAGFLAVNEGQDERAREYYGRYLQLNPGNATIRMKIAYDLAVGGDPVGAMEFIQEGLDVDPDNADLLEQYGGFAFNAAVDAAQQGAVGAQDAGGIPPEAAQYYHEAITALTRVWELKGAETKVGHLRNVVAAHLQLGEVNEAVTMAEKALETHPQEEPLWSLYADALQRAGRIDDAVTALDRLKEINPTYPNASLRQGNWLIQAGRVQDAVNILKDAVAQDPAQADVAARLVFADAYSKGVQREDYAYGIRGITAAKEIPGVTSMVASQLNFWHAYSLYQSAMKEQAPGSLASARATLPKFQQALELFGQSEEYANAQPSITLAQFLNGTQTYIDIQQAIIRRGGGD